ncbi:Trifunctional nucleotide phosphoesterase protein [Fulvia fulva]|uniref:Trifunctional nucleotide phosphoesterase protein n=1 Tax=Passalora fulva TaxID=5499 RepID=A0A9Q8P800_PASFU|nr:Trifunctional nucleotide phosphoesterase protein [Fulvia fulva]KAK4626732.1 Trifunctional nucleotide phosphoesterase protein [Fulvia fulva]KAK4627877.1 Trifunctional nucleotide phosphoesterase protein [Fulvia fulva]UJO16427.1 Trifunctional nucleotide phosphoesterase protein [Fulvia fulva]WPV13355.1 Trifunctional nucleotide phosphoesterase protein [Fulvia fulva]WPV28435.1 Trifunctional nucleotide phosphoesterase protein [Fulvia fulva]
MVEKITASLRPKLEKPIGYTLAPLDARFTTVRMKESNMGNFVCDLMRLHYLADCCIMASGTIRGDQIYPPGVLRVKDMMNCFPFEVPCVVVQVKGKEIVKALENGVSTYPALEGRFPQVSNISFTITPAMPSGQRCSDIRIGGETIDMERKYKVATRDYMVRGKDGFTSLMLKEHGGTAESIVSDENGMLISMILRQYFMSLKVLGKWKKWSTSMGNHFGKIQDDLHEVHPVKEPNQSAQPLRVPPIEDKLHDEKLESNGNTRKSLVGTAQKHTRNTSDLPARPAKSLKVGQADADSDSDDDEDADMPAIMPSINTEHELNTVRKVMRKWRRLAGIEGHPDMATSKHEAFSCHWTKGIAPRIEGRIKFAT